MPTDPGDTRLNNYILEQGYQWVRGNAEFWNPQMFYPISGTLAYTDILLGTAPIYWLLRWVGTAPDTSHQLWITLLLLLNFVVARSALKKIIQADPRAISLAAFVFAFGNPRGAQLNHQQMLPQLYFWICILASMRLIEPHCETRLSAVGWIAAFWSAWVLQIYAGFYLGWFLTLGLGAWLLAAATSRDSRLQLQEAWRKYGRAMLVGGGLAAVALLPMAIPYLRTGREIGFRRFADVKPMLPRISSWFFSGRENWLYGWQAATWPWRDIAASSLAHEHAMSVGFITLGLAAWGLWSRRNHPAIRALILASAAVALSVTMLYPRVTIWGVLYPVMPGASGIRAMARIALLFLVPIAIGLALAFDRLLAPSRRGWRAWAPWALGLCVILEQGRAQSSYDKLSIREDVEQLSAEVKRLRCPTFFYSPVLPTSASEPADHYPIQETGTPWPHRIPWKYQVDAMWAQMQTGIPTWNGYSGNFPRDWWRLLFAHAIRTEADESRVADGLRRWRELKSIQPLGACWIRLQVSH